MQTSSFFRPIAPARKPESSRKPLDLARARLSPESDSETTQKASDSASVSISASAASTSRSESRSESRSASTRRVVSPALSPLVSDTEPMVRRKINLATSKKFMQEYMYEGKIKRAPSVFLGPKKRYYTDPRGDSTFSHEICKARR